MPDFVPRMDSELAVWLASFDRALSSSYAELGFSAEQAAQYHAAQQTFQQAFEVASDAATRTPVAINLKDQARSAVVALTRVMAGQMRANPNLTSEQRQSVHLPPRRQGRRAKLPLPSEAPGVQVTYRDGNRVYVRVRVAIGTQTKPAGVRGSIIYAFTGEVPPLSLTEWTVAATTTRSLNVLRFPFSLRPGTQVWITGCWQNPTGGCGPASAPITTHIAGGGSMDVRSLAVAA